MNDDWVVEIHGPQGVRMIEIPDELVQYNKGITDDPYMVAAFLASLDLNS